MIKMCNTKSLISCEFVFDVAVRTRAKEGTQSGKKWGFWIYDRQVKINAPDFQIAKVVADLVAEQVKIDLENSYKDSEFETKISMGKFAYSEITAYRSGE